MTIGDAADFRIAPAWRRPSKPRGAAIGDAANPESILTHDETDVDTADDGVF
jgi:hypothetical protein